MIWVTLLLGVALIYFIVYNFSKYFGFRNNTTILVDSISDSIKSRKLKIPVHDIFATSVRNVLIGWIVIFVISTIMLVFLLAMYLFGDMKLVFI